MHRETRKQLTHRKFFIFKMFLKSVLPTLFLLISIFHHSSAFNNYSIISYDKLYLIFVVIGVVWIACICGCCVCARCSTRRHRNAHLSASASQLQQSTALRVPAPHGEHFQVMYHQRSGTVERVAQQARPENSSVIKTVDDKPPSYDELFKDGHDESRN